MSHATAERIPSDRGAKPTGQGASPGSLDELASMSDKALAKVYARGGVPDRLDRLDGDLEGRMLVVRAVGQGLVGRAIASFAKKPGFPWAGKSFQATDGKLGTGINRIRLGGKHRLFPFRTRIGPSVVDGAPCVIIDYDEPGNPGVIRAIHDEVREVSPGLYLGPACLKRARGDAKVVLWFGLDTRGRDRGLRAV